MTSDSRIHGQGCKSVRLVLKSLAVSLDRISSTGGRGEHCERLFGLIRGYFGFLVLWMGNLLRAPGKGGSQCRITAPPLVFLGFPVRFFWFPAQPGVILWPPADWKTERLKDLKTERLKD